MLEGEVSELRVTRRTFAGGVVAVCARREFYVLEAIAAERMPQRMFVRGVRKSPFFELRDYGRQAPRLAELLNRHGIKAALEQNGRFLFPFESLAARERAWREVSVDPEWIALQANPREISIYRASS
jgi:hypothetical protein